MRISDYEPQIFTDEQRSRSMAHCFILICVYLRKSAAHKSEIRIPKSEIER